jgi:hypothetical protein
LATIAAAILMSMTTGMPRRLTSAQQRAADSIERSAESHDRVAQSFEDLARGNTARVAYREWARRHRELAGEDRCMAARLRGIIDPA